QWESSPDGTTWANAPGTSTEATYTGSQSAATWYRVQVTCAGNGTAASTPLLIDMGSVGLCGNYCIPAMSTGCGFDYISHVSIAGIDRTSTCDNLSGANGYSFFSNISGTIMAGSMGNPYSVSTGGDVEGA